MNKNDMVDLIHHLISTGRFWHLEYAKLTVIDSEFQKIKSYREKFDEDLLKKGEDIINGIEREGNIKRIKIFLEGTETWNLSCIAFESYQGKDFQTSSGSHMWLDNCVAYGSENSINSVDSSSKIYTRLGDYQNKLIIGDEIKY